MELGHRLPQLPPQLCSGFTRAPAQCGHAEAQFRQNYTAVRFYSQLDIGLLDYTMLYCLPFSPASMDGAAGGSAGRLETPATTLTGGQSEEAERQMLGNTMSLGKEEE